MISAKHILPVLALSAAAPLVAQTLSTEITVDRTISPVEAPASPLAAVRPALLQPSLQPSALYLTEFGGDINFAPTTDSVLPSISAGLPEASPYRGYATIGYLPVYNLGARAGYRIVDKTSTRLDASARFGGSSHHSRGGTVKDNTFGIGFDGAHTFGKNILTASADYFHTAVTTPLSDDYSYSDDIDSFRFRIAAGNSRSTVEYSVAAHVDYMHYDDMQFHNTLYGFDAGIALTNSARSIRGELPVSASFINRNYQLMLGGPNPYRNTNSGIYTFRPGVRFEYGHLTLRLGARVDLASGTVGKKVHLSPDVNAQWLPSGLFAASLDLTGGESFNTLQQLYAINPHLIVDNFGVNSFAPVRGRLTLRLGSERGLSAGLSGGYTNVRNTLMPVVASPGRVAEVRLVGISGWWARVRLAYAAPSAGLKLAVQGTAYPHAYSHANPEAPDRAHYVFGAMAEVRPVKPLTIGVDYELRTGREYYTTYDLSHTPIAMRNVSDLGAHATWRMTETVAFGLHLENLLCRRTELIPGLESARLHGLLSATVLF